MNVSDIRVRIVKKDSFNLKAIVSITFDNCFVIHDIKVIENNGELFIAMPSRRTNDGMFRDIAHPINNETREMLSSLILKEYEKELGKEANENNG